MPDDASADAPPTTSATTSPTSADTYKRALFRDAVHKVIEERSTASKMLRSFWDVAREVQKRTATSLASSSSSSSHAVKSLPVFFDKDGRTGASAVWWRDAFAVSAALDGDAGSAETAAEDSDLGHAARATLFFAQDISRELLTDLHVATRSLNFWELVRDQRHGQARFLLTQTGPRNFCALARDGAYRFWCHVSAGLSGKPARFALPNASARVIIDGRVNALAELQMSLASVVGQVHHHADAIANAVGTSHSREDTRETLMTATNGLLECLEQVAKYSKQSKKKVGDLQRVVSTVTINAESPKLLSKALKGFPGLRRDFMPDLPEPTPRSPRASVDGDRQGPFTPSAADPKRPTSRLQRLASMDLTKIDGEVTHRFRQQIRVDGENLPLPKINDTLWQGLKRVEAQWTVVRDASHEALALHAKPSKHVRRWMLYAAGGSLVAVAAYMTVRRSHLCGSTELDEMIAAGKAAIRSFWKTNLRDPVKELRDELRAAFVSDRPDDANELLEESKASLERMLEEYTKQASRPGYSESLYRAYKSVGGSEHVAGEEKKPEPDPMRLVTARVEEELKSPLTNMLAGDLMQLLLLQTQVMKVEMENALMQMDQIMRANRLNFSLMACFPAALAMYSSVVAVKAYLSMTFHRRRAKRREEMRLLLAEAERALCNLKIAERRSVQQGMLIYALNSLYLALQRYHGLFSKNEWRTVRADVLELADPSISIDNKLVCIARLARTKALIPEPHRVRKL